MTSTESREGWKGDDFWIRVIEQELYPPESISKLHGFEQLMSGEELKSKKILDHGCGIGTLGRIAKERGGDVTGVDISEKLLDEARRFFPCIQADINKLPFDDGSFDYVISGMVLHIFEDIRPAIQEIARILKPGGTLILGIVHPFAELWNLETRRCHPDSRAYLRIEKRTWCFNLTNGESESAEFYHRPMTDWVNELGPYFTITEAAEPQLPEEYYANDLYARTEYLFLKLKRV